MSVIAVIIFVSIFLVALGVLLWALLQDAFINIKPGEMGIVIQRGKPADHGLAPGVHFALRFGRVIEIYPAVEMTYLTTAADEQPPTVENALTFVDPPLRVTLGDRTIATLQYTVRFKITEKGLPTIHTRFGTSGIKSILRDESRRVLIDVVGDSSTAAADAVGARRAALETRVEERLRERLAECGFELALFNLREADLAGIGAVIQEALRANEELAREKALGPVRAERAAQAVQTSEALAAGLSSETLEYLRLQVARELIERWDGKLLAVPAAVDVMSSALAPAAKAAPESATSDQAAPPA
jgi:regulator of protease activity HflC (stomatin/prohibitin superfamily)